MPIDFIRHAYSYGLPPWFPDPYLLLKVFSSLTALTLTKLYFSGTTNTSERKMHGRVVLITGGTSGIGSAAAYGLAARGAQIVLLTRLPASDPWLVEYIDEMRESTGNQLIYAEQVDLTSLYSIRKFATKWIDNAPPRRLDMILLCAATLTPPGGKRTEIDGVETTWQVNFLANFHLLGILSPAIRAQQGDRDVRIIIPTCSSYIGSPSLTEALTPDKWSPGRAYARSKLAMMVFGQAFQKHLDAYKRPDGVPNNARVVFADPGFARTPGMVRWLTRGSLLGLVCYMVMYAFAWLLLKSPFMGAQSVMFAALEGSLARGVGGRLIKECRDVDFARTEVRDEDVAKELWESSDKLIESVEKEQAVRRARMKKEKEDAEKKAKEEQEEKDIKAKEAEKVEEIEALVQAIKKGKEKEKEKEAKKPKSKKKGADQTLAS